MEVRGGDEVRGASSPAAATVVAEQLRAASAEVGRAQARVLRLVAELAERVGEEAAHRLLSGAPVAGQPSDEEVVAAAVVAELQVVLGLSEWSARETLRLAQRLRAILPETLDALAEGRLDLVRVRVLAEGTRLLDDAAARSVQAELLAGAGDCPWHGPSPRAWRTRVDRAVVRADADAARARRQEASAARMVRSWPTGHGAADLLISASAEDVAMAEAVITDLARARPAVDPTDPARGRLSLDQRRADAVMDLFRAVRDGRGLPPVSVRRVREIGLVLTADALFPDEAADRDTATARGAGDPGELRGLGDPVAIDPLSARELAHAELTRRAPLSVLLVDPAGALHRVVRLPSPPPEGWTKERVVAEVRDRVAELPALSTDGYSPGVAVQEHVRARNPRCVWFDCPRAAAGCDLDHDTPWPRGPTTVENLAPRCRRNHETKTRRLVESWLRPDGSVRHVTLAGLVVTTRPEPLPGFGVGESLGTRRDLLRC